VRIGHILRKRLQRQSTRFHPRTLISQLRTVGTATAGKSGWPIVNAGHKEMTNRLVDGMFCLHLSQVAEWSLAAQSAIGMDLVVPVV